GRPLGYSSVVACFRKTGKHLPVIGGAETRTSFRNRSRSNRWSPRSYFRRKKRSNLTLQSGPVVSRKNGQSHRFTRFPKNTWFTPFFLHVLFRHTFCKIPSKEPNSGVSSTRTRAGGVCSSQGGARVREQAVPERREKRF